MRLKADFWILFLLTFATAIVAGVMVLYGKASMLEAISFVTGALCVWLTVKESMWNFPISLLNVSVFSVVFFRAKLYADASLQVVFFILTLVGWYFWLFGGEKRTRLRIGRTSLLEGTLVLISVASLTVILWQSLRLIGGSASFFDALTTSLSLGAQWLLNRKRLENWIFWITADIIYIPLYIYKELYLTALLYGVFLIMATMGLIEWHKTWKRHNQTSAASPAETQLPVAEPTA